MKSIRLSVTLHENGITVYHQDDADITWTFTQTFPETHPSQVIRSSGAGSTFRLVIPLSVAQATLVESEVKKDQQFNSNVTTLPSEDVCTSDRYE